MADNSRESTNLPGTDGLLLSDWDLVSIDDVAIQVGSGVTPRGGRESYLNSGVPLVRSQNVLMNRLDLSDVAFIGEDVHEQMSRSSLRPGDVLLNITGASIGRVAVVPSELKVANVNQHVCKIRLNDYCDPSFVAFYLSTAMGQAQVLGNQYGATRQGLNYGQVRQLRIPHPPIPEQRAIAHVLRTVQRAKEATEKVIAATRQLKASLMRHLFTFGPVPVVNAERVKLKESDIGMLPEHWEVRPLESLARLVSGGTPSKERSEYWNGPIPWASPKDMKQPRLADAEDHISSEAAQEGSRIVPPGSVFVVIRGMILARDFPIAQAKVPMAFNQDMKAILPGDDLDSDFLLYAMVHHRARILPEIGTSAHGTKRISTSAIANFALPLPPLSEQREIARILTCSDQSILAEESRRKALAASFRSILHHLMTGKLRVRDLDPTDHSHDGTAGG